MSFDSPWNRDLISFISRINKQEKRKKTGNIRTKKKIDKSWNKICVMKNYMWWKASCHVVCKLMQFFFLKCLEKGIWPKYWMHKFEPRIYSVNFSYKLNQQIATALLLPILLIAFSITVVLKRSFYCRSLCNEYFPILKMILL